MIRKASALGAGVLTAGLSIAGLGALAGSAGAAPAKSNDTIVNYNTYNITYNITINNYGTLTIYFTAGGFKPGELVSEVLHSKPVSMGKLRAGSTGNVSTSVLVPKSLPAGEHELLLTGLTSGHVDAMSFYDPGAKSGAGSPASALGGSTSGTSGAGGSVATGGIVTSSGGSTATAAKTAAKTAHARLPLGLATTSVGATANALPSVSGAAARTFGSGSAAHSSIGFKGSTATEATAAVAVAVAVGGLGVVALRKRKRQSWAVG
jgi:hypothetical protein